MILYHASIDKRTGRVGVGVVVRDSQGKVTVARCLTSFSTLLEQTVDKALASYYATKLCQELLV